jgi:hypothetical protein
MNSASLKYKNKSANKGAQLVPMGIQAVCWKIWLPKTTKMLSMRNSNISLMSTSEYLCVESESRITKYVREWLTTKYEYKYFLLPFLLNKQLSIMPKSIVFNYAPPPSKKGRHITKWCCLSVGLSIGQSSQFPFISFFFSLVAHTEMKFGIQIYYNNI